MVELNSKGMFSVLLLLASVALLGNLHIFEQSKLQEFQKAHSAMLALEKANLLRTNLEVEFDQLIQRILKHGIEKNKSAEDIALEINKKMLDSIGYFEEDSGESIEFFLQQGDDPATQTIINSENLSDKFSVILVPLENKNLAAIFTYHGGANRDWRFLAHITANQASQDFEIPIGYTQCVLKSWEEFEC